LPAHRGPGTHAEREARPNDGHTAWLALLDAASAPYRRVSRFAWHFARGKLGRDPVFRAMLERGWLMPRARVLDIGCGQGLMASLLLACGQRAQQGHWPAQWKAAPSAAQYTGIDLMARDIVRAELALAAAPGSPRFVCADMRTADLPACDLVVILDVLHYVDHAAQAAVLGRVRQALGAGGRLLLRVGDMQDSWRFAISQWVDRAVTRVRGHPVAPTWGRTLPQWLALLAELGFRAQPAAMSQGTPFANVLLVCDLAPAAADASGAMQ
jgi:SAM-dependent methyltransferase